VVSAIACLACQGEFLVNNLLHVNDNDEHALDFALHLSRLSSVSMNLNFSIGRIVAPALVTSDNPGQEGCVV
jgi:hypothetical protein